jgi:hypothetical protein
MKVIRLPKVVHPDICDVQTTEQDTGGCLTQGSMKTMSTQTPTKGLKAKSTRIGMDDQLDKTSNRVPKSCTRAAAEQNPEVQRSCATAVHCVQTRLEVACRRRKHKYMYVNACMYELPSGCCLSLPRSRICHQRTSGRDCQCPKSILAIRVPKIVHRKSSRNRVPKVVHRKSSPLGRLQELELVLAEFCERRSRHIKQTYIV